MYVLFGTVFTSLYTWDNMINLNWLWYFLSFIEYLFYNWKCGTDRVSWFLRAKLKSDEAVFSFHIQFLDINQQFLKCLPNVLGWQPSLKNFSLYAFQCAHVNGQFQFSQRNMHPMVKRVCVYMLCDVYVCSNI